jgi:hypothetical protein
VGGWEGPRLVHTSASFSCEQEHLGEGAHERQPSYFQCAGARREQQHASERAALRGPRAPCKEGGGGTRASGRQTNRSYTQGTCWEVVLGSHVRFRVNTGGPVGEKEGAGDGNPAGGPPVMVTSVHDGATPAALAPTRRMVTFLRVITVPGQQRPKQRVGTAETCPHNQHVDD